jgi:hypothetical protein
MKYYTVRMPNLDEVPTFAKPPSYHSFLLRFWEERGSQPAVSVWRFSVEDPLTDKRHSFADLASLMNWLRDEMDQTTTSQPTLAGEPKEAPPQHTTSKLFSSSDST